jgi:hypothetical protein
MNKRLILTTLVSAAALSMSASALASTTPTGASLPRFHSTLIVPGRSAGGVSLGESAAKAIKAWGGNSSCVPGPALLSCTWGSDNNGSTGTAELDFVRGKVNYIDLTLGDTDQGVAIHRGALMKLKTKKGIGMGSSDAQLLKAYGASQVGSNELGFTLGSGSHTTTFRTSAGRFVTILIGTPRLY